MNALPPELRADVLLDRAAFVLLAMDVRAGVPPAVAVHVHCGPDRPQPQPRPTPAGAHA